MDGNFAYLCARMFVHKKGWNQILKYNEFCDAAEYYKTHASEACKYGGCVLSMQCNQPAWFIPIINLISYLK